MNDRQLEALTADLATLTALVANPALKGEKCTAMRAALLRLKDYSARGYPSGGSGGGKSTEVSDPTARAAERQSVNERDQMEYAWHLKMLAFHAKGAARIVHSTRPAGVKRDDPASPCGNIHCEHVCTGEGQDKIRTPKGRTVGICPRCTKHWERHQRDWPTSADGRDVRLGTERKGAA